MTEPDRGAQPTAPEYRRRTRRTGIIVAAIVAVLVLVVAVVAFALGRGGSGGGEAAGTELTVGLQLEPTNLDIRSTAGVALDQILIDNVYQGLIGLAPGAIDEFVPVLAEELPEVSADGRRYAFALREGVTFHSGAELTAQDVVDSLGATLTEDLLGTAAAVTAPDDRSIEIELGEPNSQLLWQLAGRAGLVFETADTGDLASTANGTGPYLLDEWKQGDSIAFRANPDYWGDAATVGTVVWRYIPDGNAAVNAALDGDVDVLAPVLPSLASQFEGNAGFEVRLAAGTDVFTLAYNSAKAPLDDIRVRTALSKAIDGDAIVTAFYGNGVTLGGPITELEPGYEDLTAVNAYDPEGARALLAEAGASGLELTVAAPNFYTTEALDQVVTQLAEVGVTLRIESVEFATWLSEVYQAPEGGGPRAFDLSYVNHAEARDFANYVSPGYYFGAVDEEAARLYAESLAATDADEADALLREAARAVAEQAPAKWLINYTPANVIGAGVHGFPESNTNSRINLAGVTVD